MNDSYKPKRNLMPTCLICIAALADAILAVGCKPRDTNAGTDKQACAAIIQRAIASSRSRDEAEALVRADPQARKVCAGLEMNGAPVIP